MDANEQALTTRPQTRRRSAAKHGAILAAAAALVGEAGYRAVTIEAIAARAGVGKQTIYRWWPSKAALLVETYAGLVPPDLLPDDGGSGRDALHALLAAVFQRYRTTPAGAILAGLVGEAAADPAVADAVRTGLIPSRRGLLTGPLKNSIGRGELPGWLDPDLAAECITAQIWYRLLVSPQSLTDALAGRMLDQIYGPGEATSHAV